MTQNRENPGPRDTRVAARTTSVSSPRTTLDGAKVPPLRGPSRERAKELGPTAPASLWQRRTRLDELKEGETFEAVVMVPKAEVASILRGTAKPHRVMLIELVKDGPTRIPGRVGNVLRFRQAKTVQIHSAGKAAAGYAGHKAAAVRVAPVETCVISIRIPEAYLSAERWKHFRTNPTRVIAKWASEGASLRHVVVDRGVAWQIRQAAFREGSYPEKGPHQPFGGQR